ncbi:hypothetical protein PHLGIDRAFT_240261 [Phlebiopsis gigantea 11061_1 CR5-6]|uniref:Uncharacterized protein n=1 Tax=Phlebiopsis gigantea (strain 11061_1 CR5-6) TaxID=745531 RepID=A0A0C3NY93_PHLG1|nr:hypothetical protein PHLGIDRAFT_240261 [Phlebiopsis gigantea 11061_1 CR5-6]
MSTFNSTALIVDDRDINVKYSPGWQQQSTTAEFDDTKSGANEAGMTATLQFTGTGVEVYGSLGSWDVYGVPVSSYVVDGGDEATYTAPLIQPGFFEARILFYRSPPLDPGAHTLVITNKNGTKPCVYWLDYFIYTPVVTTSLPPSSPPTTQVNAPTTQGSNSTPTLATPPPTSNSIQQGSTQQSTASQGATTHSLSPVSQNNAASSTPSSSAAFATSNGVTNTGTLLATVNTSSTASQQAGSATPSQSASAVAAAASTSRARVSSGAIAGGVVGGLAILTLLFIALLLCHRRIRQRSDEDLSPFVLGSGAVPANRGSRSLGSSSTVHMNNEKASGPRNAQSGASFASPDALLPTHAFTSTSQPLQGGESAQPAPGEAEFDRFSHSDRGVTSPEAPTSTSWPSDPRTMILTKLRDMRHARDGSGASSVSLVRQHEDSGVRMLPRAEQSFVDIPPAYSTN